jgi:hypothetical protein
MEIVVTVLDRTTLLLPADNYTGNICLDCNNCNCNRNYKYNCNCNRNCNSCYRSDASRNVNLYEKRTISRYVSGYLF